VLPIACCDHAGTPLPRYRFARARRSRDRPQSRSEALTGTVGAWRAWTASMISALSMP
jgi:hypothetical protein